MPLVTDRSDTPTVAAELSTGDCTGNLHTIQITHQEIPLATPLADRLQATIAREGPITFAAFMEAALYDPADGYFSRLPVGERGDFVTSPHVSPVFGRLVARQVAEFWQLMGRPQPFDVVEAGAGDGTLAAQVLNALESSLTETLRYHVVERSAAARSALAALGLHDVQNFDELDQVENGCVLANEVLDNLPFHRLKATEAGLRELFVDTDGSDGFVTVEGPVSSDLLARLAPEELTPGQESVVSPAALAFLDRGADLLARGYLWLVDYAATAGGAQIHGYRGHRVETDVLTDPGSRDITAGVDFRALARHAVDRGLHVWGPVTQRDVLLALGFRELDQWAQARQVEAIAARRGIDALRIYSDRNRANLLLGRTGLGAFSVLCIGVGDVPSPPSITAERRP
jgi:SAM-dependent MidA family methyltransferase